MLISCVSCTVTVGTYPENFADVILSMAPDRSTLKLETTGSLNQFQVSKGPLAAWIGLYQTENGADWVWMDGTPTGYFNWNEVDYNIVFILQP